MLYADTTRTTATLREGSRPTAGTTTTTRAADRHEAALQGPTSLSTVRSGRRPRRRNAPPSAASTNRVAAAGDDDDAAEFPVTFNSAELFVVTKAKLYSKFTISMKVCNVSYSLYELAFNVPADDVQL